MTNDLRVARVRAYAVQPRQTLPVRYHGRMEPLQPNVEIVRVTLENGAEGEASAFGGFPRRDAGWIARELEPLAERMIGCDPARRAELTQKLLSEAGPGPWGAISLLDCAMWGAYACGIGQPLYRLLGGYRERIPAQASVDAFDTIEAYLDITQRCVAMGYGAVKLHMKTEPDFDVELIRVISEAYGDGKIRFMTDHEQQHDFDEAVRIGEAMSKGPFDWFEAPLPDTDLDAYVELNRAVGVDIIPAGNTVVGLENWRIGLERKAWSRLRFDALNVGGVTTAIKAMGLARAMEVPVEIQSYAFGPGQQVNLHVMLGMSGANWFEHPAPSGRFDYPVRNPLVLDAHGCVGASDRPGLGIDMNWDDVEANAVVIFDSAA
ncbi:MAG: enolase C-terminal domain-like protein [Alphaproteobacteria bacterium]|nr:enolase C-terminal domain-like protein [Alphaproteobacteria bacterium]